VDNKTAHMEWFREELIDNGAPASITNEQVAASAGFIDSERSYHAGWAKGKAEGRPDKKGVNP